MARWPAPPCPAATSRDRGRSPVYLVLKALAGQARRQRGGDASATSAVGRAHVRHVAGAVHRRRVRVPTIFNDVGEATFSVALKDVTNASLIEPSTNNTVTLTTLSRDLSPRRRPQHARRRRALSASTAAPPSRSRRWQRRRLGFEVVRHVAKQESPLVQLATNPTIITTIAEVTFYGTDRSATTSACPAACRSTSATLGTY